VTAPDSVGRYDILREIGRGGMATVYLARQTDLDRFVALKELSALAAADAVTARRFVRESRLAGSLNHPNIVTVHDFFEHRGTPYIAMELLERGSLRSRMSGLTFAQVAGVLEGLLAGLRHAHDRGIVHRDVKPENLMISDDARVKIADFGIAKATDEAGTLLTVTGTTIGTPTYMAPEQAMGGEIGPWTDLYAVGIIAFELLAGRPPFDTSGTPMAVLLRHVNDDPLTLSTLRPSVDPRLSDWIAELLATDAADRTQSAAAAWLAFEEIALERLGSRWRHDTPLNAAQGGATPATMRLGVAPTPATLRQAATARTVTPTPVTPRQAATARTVTPTPVTPRQAATARTVMPRAAAAAVAAAAPRRRGAGRRARGLARLLVLIVGLAVAIAVGLSGTPGSSPRGEDAAPAAGAGRHARPLPAGVGDSQSDDPSDDEEDGPEP
jgi:protein kinase-like protein